MSRPSLAERHVPCKRLEQMRPYQTLTCLRFKNDDPFNGQKRPLKNVRRIALLDVLSGSKGLIGD
jgi:hypothetical protein